MIEITKGSERPHRMGLSPCQSSPSGSPPDPEYTGSLPCLMGWPELTAARQQRGEAASPPPATSRIPATGQIIRRTQIDQFDVQGCRLNWRPDNTAKVTRPAPDLAGMTQCSKAETCQAASYCASGKPHSPDPVMDAMGTCYDHRPYIVGGIAVWGTACESEIQTGKETR